MSTTQTIAPGRFKGAVGFTLNLRRWGNARKGFIENVKTSSDPDQDKKTKERLTLKKRLIASEEFEAICTFQGKLREWIYSRTTPSFFREGFQLVKLEGVSMIESKLAEAQTELESLVGTLCLVYPSQVEEARIALGNQFNEGDYPSVDELPRFFSIGWNWIDFTVPEGLPAELRQKEQDKLERQFSDAGQQITLALREGFMELISHASSRLTCDPGEKPKVIRETMIGNIKEFIETFSQRNLMNDVELQKLVDKARDILALNNVTTQKLREKADIRDSIKQGFDEIKASLDPLITEGRTRSFEFEEEEAA